MVVRNGKTTGFSTGVYFVDETASTIENVTTERNRFGFYIHASNKNVVKNSDVEFNIYGLHLQNSKSVGCRIPFSPVPSASCIC